VAKDGLLRQGRTGRRRRAGGHRLR